MTTPIERALSVTAPVADKVVEWFNRELIPIVSAVRAIANESATAYVAPTGAYAWNMAQTGTLFLDPTVSITVSVDAAVVQKNLRPGRKYYLVVYNNTGGPITVSFSSDFEANAPSIPDATVATWTFVRLDFNATITANFIEVS